MEAWGQSTREATQAYPDAGGHWSLNAHTWLPKVRFRQIILEDEGRVFSSAIIIEPRGAYYFRKSYLAQPDASTHKVLE